MIKFLRARSELQRRSNRELAVATQLLCIAVPLGFMSLWFITWELPAPIGLRCIIIALMVFILCRILYKANDD